MSLIKKLLNTNDDVSLLVLRIMLAVVMFPHGAQKVFGWFGGHGFSGTMAFFTQNMHIPPFFAFMAILAESVGSLLLFLGLFTRVAALGIGINMAVAMFLFHLPNGFFMNWFGGKQGEGFEYHILAIAIALALVIRGGGKASLDRSPIFV